MSEKMNVLFIITDQQRADHLGCYGNRDLRTPNIDKLADESVRFSNAFCANPMCMPNRASLLTGLYPNMHGVRSNGINLPENVPTMTGTLRERDWYTKAIGKLHFQFYFPPFKRSSNSSEMISAWIRSKNPEKVRKRFDKPYYGFEDVEMTLGHGDLVCGHYFDWLEEKVPEMLPKIKKRFTSFFETLMYDTELTEESYNTSYIKDRTINFLENYTEGEYGDNPFFLHCSFPDPHHPVCPPGKYKDMFNPDEIELPSSFKYKDDLYEHPFLKRYVKDPVFRGALLRESTEEEIRQFIASTYGSIAMIDDAVGQILSSLSRLGLDNDTMVIFTSDHGDLSGDHGLLLKGPSPYKGVLNVPLLWKVPGLTKKSVSDSLISSVDIPKTILHLLGIKERRHPPNFQGYDMSSVLEDPSKKVRNCCLIEEDEEVSNIRIRLRHLVTEDHRITLYNGINDYGDIFSTKNDPDEVNNLWDKDKELKHNLVKKLFFENLKLQSRYPKREALS
jgi:arylsulfatase A-like enzyme